MKNKQSKSLWRYHLSFIKNYFFHSDQRFWAWFYLITILGSILGLVLLSILFSMTFGILFTSLAAMAITPFIIAIIKTSLIVLAFVLVRNIKNYLCEKLIINWRNWMVRQYSKQLFEGHNDYLDLKRSNLINQIGQRIQENTLNYTKMTVSLSTGFLENSLYILIAAVSLAIIGGSLSFTVFGFGIFIPFYLVWAGLIVAVASTIITVLIGRKLTSIRAKSQQLEANLRDDLTTVMDNAEEIAEEHASKFFKRKINRDIYAVKQTSQKQLATETRIGVFQMLYEHAAMFLPSILTAPLYFTGKIAFAVLPQIGIYFTQMTLGLTWFASSYSDISECRASLVRLSELDELIHQKDLTHEKAIKVKMQPNNIIHLHNVTIMSPCKKNSNPIVKNVNMTFREGQHILIQGDSGIGKSTVFKVISGSWRYGTGVVYLPKNKRIYFLPQKPFLPNGTLKEVLAYPEPVSRYTDQQYRDALNIVGGNMIQFSKNLNDKADWSKRLSGGQLQRISFARAILKKPDWLFLDEATASLDEKSEYDLYQLITSIKGTTVVSIAHRSTVQKYHNKILFFKSANDESASSQDSENVCSV